MHFVEPGAGVHIPTYGALTLDTEYYINCHQPCICIQKEAKLFLYIGSADHICTADYGMVAFVQISIIR